MNNFAPNSSGLLVPIYKWLQDDTVTEILINKPREVIIEKNGEFIYEEIDKFNEYHLDKLFQLIVNENVQVINAKNPIVSASLSDNIRIQLVLPPVAKYHTIEIRKQVIKNFSLFDYNKKKFSCIQKNLIFMMNAKYFQIQMKVYYMGYIARENGIIFLKKQLNLKRI